MIENSISEENKTETRKKCLGFKRKIGNTTYCKNSGKLSSSDVKPMACWGRSGKPGWHRGAIPHLQYYAFTAIAPMKPMRRRLRE